MNFRIIALLLIFFSIFFLGMASATKYTLSGEIATLKPQAGVDGDYLTIVDEASAGSCLKVGGLVAVRIPDIEERMFALALAAKLNNRSVNVSVDDSSGNNLNGYCVIRWIEFTD